MTIDQLKARAYVKLREAVARDPRCESIDDAARRTASPAVQKAWRAYQALVAESQREQ